MQVAIWRAVSAAAQHVENIGDRPPVTILGYVCQIKDWRTCLLSFFSAQYRLTLPEQTNLTIYEKCLNRCLKLGMVLMPLESDKDRQTIADLTITNNIIATRSNKIAVWTDATVKTNKKLKIRAFSRPYPYGKRVKFIKPASFKGEVSINHNVVIYQGAYHTPDVIEANNLQVLCACKSQGELAASFSYSANFLFSFNLVAVIGTESLGQANGTPRRHKEISILGDTWFFTPSWSGMVDRGESPGRGGKTAKPYIECVQ